MRAVRAVRACVRECGRAGVRARTARGGQVVCVGYDDLRRRCNEARREGERRDPGEESRCPREGKGTGKAWKVVAGQGGGGGWAGWW